MTSNNRLNRHSALRVAPLVSLTLFGGVLLASCTVDEVADDAPATGGTGATGGTTGGAMGKAGTGGSQSGAGGSVAGTGGSKAGAGGASAGSAGSPAGAGGAAAGSAGSPAGAGGTVAGSGGAQAGSAGASGASAGGGAGGSAGTAAGSGGTAGGGNTEPCSGPGMLEVGDSLHNLDVEGQDYPFNIHVPDQYDGTTRLPVLFDFHGLGGDENQMQRLSGWAAAGDRHGFITVFPGGPDNGWNAGGCCKSTPTDLEYVRRAITWLDENGCVDTKRIYASGCSNGGAMSFRLACEAADVIAAVAPVDFDCVVGGRCADCEPSRPITEIQFRGTNDSAVNYSGAQPNFETWGGINQCTGTPEPMAENDSCERFPMCADGVETILCSVQNGSHCGSYMSFEIAELAWSVISKYSLP